MFGTGLSLPIPDIDRTDYMLILGANPLASNGSLMTAPDFRGRLHGDPRPRRPDRRRRPAPDPDRRGRRRAPPDPAGPRRPFPRRHRPHDGRRAARRPRRRLVRARRRRSTRSARRSRRSPPRPSRRPAASPPTRSAGSPATSPRRRRACRLRPDRHDDAGVRDARELAGRRDQRADRKPRPPGRGDVPARRRRPDQLSRRRGRGRGFEMGRWSSRVRGLPESFGELPVSCLAEEITEPGDGRGPRPDHGRRQSRWSRPRTPGGCRRRSTRSTCSSRSTAT